MDFAQASKMLSSGGVRYFIPSFKADLLFSKLNTGIQKRLVRNGYDERDPYVSHISRIGLFDEMLLERTREIKSSMLTIVDQAAFIAQLKKSSIGKGKMKTIMVCPNCGSEVETEINLDKVIENCRSYEFKEISAEYGIGDKSNRFVLHDASWLDLVVLFNGIHHSRYVTLSEVETARYLIYSKICLYIKTIYIDNEELKNDSGQIFSKLTVPQRLEFFDKLPSSITISEDNEHSILALVSKNFNDSEISDQLFAEAIDKTTCKKCNEKLEGALSYDNFFVQ